MNIQMLKKKLICGCIGKSGIIHQPLLLRVKLGLLHIHFFFFFVTCPSSVQIFCTCFLFPEGNNQWKSNHVANFKDQKGKIHEPQLLKLWDTWSTLNMNFHMQEPVWERFKKQFNFQKWYAYVFYNENLFRNLECS